MTAPDTPPTPEQVAEAQAWFRQRAPHFGLHTEDPAQVHAATLVRAWLAEAREPSVPRAPVEALIAAALELPGGSDRLDTAVAEVRRHLDTTTNQPEEGQR